LGVSTSSRKVLITKSQDHISVLLFVLAFENYLKLFLYLE
jgi:hypothetical protein